MPRRLLFSSLNREVSTGQGGGGNISAGKRDIHPFPLVRRIFVFIFSVSSFVYSLYLF